MIKICIISKTGFVVTGEQYAPVNATAPAYDIITNVPDKRYFRLDIEGEHIEIAELRKENGKHP